MLDNILFNIFIFLLVVLILVFIKTYEKIESFKSRGGSGKGRGGTRVGGRGGGGLGRRGTHGGSRFNKGSPKVLGPVGGHRYISGSSGYGGYSRFPYAPAGYYVIAKLPCRINEDCPFRNCTSAGFCEN